MFSDPVSKVSKVVGASQFEACSCRLSCCVQYVRTCWTFSSFTPAQQLYSSTAALLQHSRTKWTQRPSKDNDCLPRWLFELSGPLLLVILDRPQWSQCFCLQLLLDVWGSPEEEAAAVATPNPTLGPTWVRGTHPSARHARTRTPVSRDRKQTPAAPPAQAHFLWWGESGCWLQPPPPPEPPCSLSKLFPWGGGALSLLQKHNTAPPLPRCHCTINPKEKVQPGKMIQSETRRESLYDPHPHVVSGSVQFLLFIQNILLLHLLLVIHWIISDWRRHLRLNVTLS